MLATLATVIASQAVISGAFRYQEAIQLRVPAADEHPSHVHAHHRADLHPNRELAPARVGHRCWSATFRSPTGLANAYGIALSAIFATNTLLAFVVFRMLWRKPLWMVVPGAAFFISIELTFFAANLTKILSGGWFPLVVGAIFFTILTTWHRGRAMLARP